MTVVFVVVIRLHRMYEMQSIVTDYHGVCQSFCHADQSSFTVQKWLNGSRCCWGEHFWGSMEHCVRRGPDPLQTEGGELGKMLPIVDSQHISRMAEPRDLKFCVHTEDRGP